MLNFKKLIFYDFPNFQKRSTRRIKSYFERYNIIQKNISGIDSENSNDEYRIQKNIEINRFLYFKMFFF